MRKSVYLASRTNCIVCPSCGMGKLFHGEEGESVCGRCNAIWDEGVTDALKQIASLPDALGEHACECGHPEMRRLPDGVYHCPSCGSEVLPIDAVAGDLS